MQHQSYSVLVATPWLLTIVSTTVMIMSTSDKLIQILDIRIHDSYPQTLLISYSNPINVSTISCLVLIIGCSRHSIAATRGP